MTIIATYEVTATPPIGKTPILRTGAWSHDVRWRIVSQRKPSKFRNISIPDHTIASLWQAQPQRIRGLSNSSSSCKAWQSSTCAQSVDMLTVNSSSLATVQANMVLLAVTLALGSLLLAALVLLGLSILFHPLWVVRWTQKLQPHVLYLKPTQEKIVALTLDDGPHAHITPRILDILKESDCKATWFIIGKHMERCPDIVERIRAEGHEVANHMMVDVASWTLSKREFEVQLVECDNLLKNFFPHNSSGQLMKWFRPGHGFYNPMIVETCKEHGYRVALGSLYPMDHMFVRQAKLLARNLLWRIHPGGVIILHDRVPQYAQTPENVVIQVLRLLLPELKKRGYKVVTLSELDESVTNTEMKRIT